MDCKKLNTTIEYKFQDGDKVKLTLAFYSLYKLKSTNKALYDRYNKAMLSLTKEEYDELELLTILYAAYLCAHDSDVEPLSEEEFLYKCGSDRISVMRAVNNLTTPKKK